MGTNIVSISNHTNKVPKGPRGFEHSGRAFTGELQNWFEGPSRETNTALGSVLSAYSKPDGFSVTIGNAELKLPEARRVLAAFTAVLEAVEQSAATWEVDR